MAKYFFDVADGTRLSDSSGLECRDDAGAAAAAQIIAGEIARTPHQKPRQIIVLNEAGDRVTTVAVKARFGETENNGR